MDEALQFLIRHGLLALFVIMLADQLALPVPMDIFIFAAGGLAGAGKIAFVPAVAVLLAAGVIGNVVWYALGRRHGGPILKFLCRISIEPDSCVRRTQNLFTRHGAKALLLAKFVPGLNTVAQPLAGILGMRPGRFVAFDALGAAAWTGTYVGLGYVFSDRLAEAGRAAQRLGWWLAVLLAGAAALFLALKWVRRRRFLRQLHVDRITPDELKRRLDQGEDVAIVDMRQPVDFDAAPFVIPGARHLLPVQVTDPATDWRSDREIVLYCT